MTTKYIIAHHWPDEPGHVTLMPGSYTDRKEAQCYAARFRTIETKPGHRYEVCVFQDDLEDEVTEADEAYQRWQNGQP